MRTRIALAATSLAALAWACGNGSVNKPSATGGTSGGSGSSGGGGSSGGSSGGSTGASGFAGEIEAVESLVPVDGGASVQSFVVSADFYPNIGSGGAGCGTGEGNCCYAPPSGGGGSNPTGAGTLTVLDGTATLGTLAFDPVNGYGVLSTATWSGGDELTVQGSGDANGVAAFSVSAGAPTQLGSLNPDLTAGAVSISVGADGGWTLTWTPGSPPGQGMILSIGPNPNVTTAAPMGTITCTPNDSDGTVTVDPSLLANFSAGQTAQVSFSRVNSGSTKNADASVIFQVSSVVLANASFTP